MGLAASVLALTTVGGLATTAYLHQRQARAAQVELALNETTLLHDQALKAPGDLGRWKTTREAIKRVEVALGDDGNARDRLRLDDLRREVETGFAAARRDRELLDALAEIRSGHLGAKPGVTDMAYAQAFRGAGIDLDILTPAEAAARLHARPAAVVLQVLPYLDSWSLVRRNDEQPAERWRHPWTWPAPPTPTPIAIGSARCSNARTSASRARPCGPCPGSGRSPISRPPASSSSPPRLREAGDPGASVTLLESAAQRLPDDVWINYDLAEVLAGIPAQA